MNQCATCSHYTPKVKSTGEVMLFGRCDNTQKLIDKLSPQLDGYGEMEVTEFLPDADFGCIFHEARE